MTWPLSKFTGKDVVFVGVGQGRSMQGFKNFITKHGQIKSFSGVEKQVGASPLGFLKDYDAGTYRGYYDVIINRYIAPDKP